MGCGDTLTRLRKEKGLSQREVADELGITRQAVSQWEAGTTMPSMEKLIALSQLYRVPVDALYQEGWEPAGEPEPAAEEQRPVEEPEAEAEREPPPPPPDVPEDGEAPKRHRRHRPIILLGIICAYVLIYLWGVLTHSENVATLNMVLLTFVILLGISLYGIYLLITHFRRIRK